MLRSVLAAAASLLLAATALAQSTAFTYHGQLKDGDVPAAGQHDFRFRLLDAASGGTQLGATQCIDNIQVNDGVFTTTIDFGNQFASSNQRFIEIEVRRETGLDCLNTTGYTTLSPRLPITPTPTAIQATSAFSLAAPDGSPATAAFVDNNGNLGIGTTSPTAPLHVNGVIQWGGAVTNFAYSGEDSNGLYLEQKGGSVVTSRMRLLSSMSGDFVNYSQFNIDPNAGFSFMPQGSGNLNVGIGTATPVAKLDVRGDICLGSSGQFRVVAAQSNLRIIRGVVSATGSIIAGSGFSVTRNAQGNYTITFLSGFPSTPAVTSVAENSGTDLFVMTDGVNALSARLLVLSKFGAPPSTRDGAFHFIAIGQR